MDQWIGKVAIVTGASSGIGYGIALTLADKGMKVIAVARREQRLIELSRAVTGNGQIKAVTADITKEQDIIKVFQTAEKSFGGCHVLVNNAGVCLNTKVLDCNLEQWRRTFDLNVLAVGVATREAIATMKRNNIADGYIINISSISAYNLPDGSGKHVYNASKHALRVITEGLRAELNEQKSNIKVTMICPGVVKTEIFEAGNWGNDYTDLPALGAQDIADSVVTVLSTPPNTLVTALIIRPRGETIPA